MSAHGLLSLGPQTGTMPVEFESRFDAEPTALPESADEAALRRIEWVAYVLDDGIALPGTGQRVGLDPLVGLLPAAGDTAAAVVGLYVVAEAARQGVAKRTLARMVLNLGLDAGAGSVPVVGDLFDAAWKANKRNARLALRDLSESDESAIVEAEPELTT